MVKVNAFSLFESVVAIAIISVCIGIGATIYSNVISAEKPLVVIKGQEEIKRLLHDLKTSKLYMSQSFDFEDYRIDQEINPYQGNQLIYQVDYKLFVGGALKAQQQHLVYNEE